MARPKINYSKMKLGELTALRDEIQTYLEKTQAAKRAAWFKDVMEQAKQYGIDFAKMFGGPRRGRPKSSRRASRNRHWRMTEGQFAKKRGKNAAA
jgi:hypothetical protein